MENKLTPGTHNLHETLKFLAQRKWFQTGTAPVFLQEISNDGIPIFPKIDLMPSFPAI
jgi:hypothetical protein